MKRERLLLRSSLICVLLSVLCLDQACAYIGPGAGFALFSSFMAIFIAVVTGVLVILTLPFKAVVSYIRYRRICAGARADRVVVIGLDGLDPDICEKMMNNGELPFFSTLREKGTFRRLRTTLPAISPVAWSTFATGVNPGKHRIFDFFTRDPGTYLPVISSAIISPGPPPSARLLRMSRPVWTVLSETGIFSSVIRVPITFPPEKFRGVCLSAMCAPDLLGTQGTYTVITSGDPVIYGSDPAGRIISVEPSNGCFETMLDGPPSGNGQPFSLRLSCRLEPGGKTAIISAGTGRFRTALGKYSPWVKLVFRHGRKKIRGVARFLLKETSPDIVLYITPVNIDPERPALPISHPSLFSVYLSKMHGPFATLGLAEDTNAFNDGIIDAHDFLEQSYEIFENRRTLLRNAVRNTRRGLVTAVFDTSDRIQHMFFREMTNGGNQIADMYRRMDAMVGEISRMLGPDEPLIVISDHGFKHFEKGLNLNAWLRSEGYLVLRDGTDGRARWLKDVDWSRTRAYSMGLAGIFINSEGRESGGIVKSEEKEGLCREIARKLEALRDGGNPVVSRARFAPDVFNGPYVQDSPDIIVACRETYRLSWSSASGRTSGNIIEPNERQWSGDHCMDPELVPGVMFSNWCLEEDGDPSIQDMAPTILAMLGAGAQPFHDGRPLHFDSPRGKK